jgi:tRNA/rRNA methyltransferase
MLSEDERARVCVVLVRARNPNNIGAVARAMHGFGFDDLRLVNDYSVPLERARSAVDAAEILAQARQFPSVSEAVADCSRYSLDRKRPV